MMRRQSCCRNRDHGCSALSSLDRHIQHRQYGRNKPFDIFIEIQIKRPYSYRASKIMWIWIPARSMGYKDFNGWTCKCPFILSRWLIIETNCVNIVLYARSRNSCTISLLSRWFLHDCCVGFGCQCVYKSHIEWKRYNRECLNAMWMMCI